MPRRQIAVTDGETGHKGEIKSIDDAPPLYTPDQESGPDHREKNPREDRPEHANKPKELCKKDAPDLPWSHWSPAPSRFYPWGQRRGAFPLSGHPLVLGHKHMIHVICTAGLVPAIHVSASHRSARRGCGDARIESGHDQLGGIMHHLNEFSTSLFRCPKIRSRRRRPPADRAAYAFSTNLRLRTRIRLEMPSPEAGALATHC